jgi:hypothetical protein
LIINQLFVNLNHESTTKTIFFLTKLTPTQKIFIQYCQQNGLPAPIPEFRFHEKRKWRIDYFFESEGKRVGLEVEGGIWQMGRHNRPFSFLKDVEKYNSMAMQGIYLLRIQPKDLLKKSTIEMLKTILHNA